MRKLRSVLAVLFLAVTLLFAGCGGSDVRVNIDLSEMSSYMVQSEVQKMQKASTAQKYLGKNIKLRVKHFVPSTSSI